MTGPLSLTTVSMAADAFVDQIQRLVNAGAETFHLSPWNSLADGVAAKVAQAGLPCRLTVAGQPGHDPEPNTGQAADEPDVHVRLETDGEELARSLMDLTDLRKGWVLVPRTARFGLGLPLFLISIPKSGTHLLIELARSLGYTDGGVHDGDVRPGAWYYVEYSNSHTAAPDFFVDTVRRSPFGNRHHPFSISPTLFIYRHPYDILVSEANYFHNTGNSLFHGYLNGLRFEERLERLADDRWLFGSLRDRVARFAAWLEFHNVAPVSFEELVGFAGGGDPELQRRTLWSLLLKLQVDGNVDQLSNRIFNPRSPTFNQARIGSHREALTPRVQQILQRLDDDYLRVFGYRRDLDGPLTSLRIDEFRRRPLRLGRRPHPASAILIEQNFLGWNLIRFRDRYFAVRISAGQFDLGLLDEEARSAYPSADCLAELRLRVVEMLVGEQAARAVNAALAEVGIPFSAATNSAPVAESPVTPDRLRRAVAALAQVVDPPAGHHRGYDIYTAPAWWFGIRTDAETGVLDMVAAPCRTSLIHTLEHRTQDECGDSPDTEDGTPQAGAGRPRDGRPT